MVSLRLPTVAAGLARSLQHRDKVAPLRVIQQRSQVARQPKFGTAVIALANALEGGVVLLGDAFFSHGDLRFSQRLARAHDWEGD